MNARRLFFYPSAYLWLNTKSQRQPIRRRTGGASNSPAIVERLEEKLLLSAVSDGAYQVLHDRTTFNQENFFVYLDADSGFNHGFPSNFFAGDAGGVRLDLINQIRINLSAIDDPNSIDGVSTDPNRLDRVHGTVWQITIPALDGFGEFAGVGFEEPALHGEPVTGVGYNLSDTTHVLFEARTPVPGGIDVQFGVGGRNTDRNNPYHLTNDWTTYSIDLGDLRNPDTNILQPPSLADVHYLFTVVLSNQFTPNGGTVLIDNVRYDPVPANPTGGPRLNFPVGNDTFGVIPAVIYAVDDGDADFNVTGNWNLQDEADAYGTDQQTAANTAPATATWTINNLEPRIYEIQATWTPNAANATNARFEILDGGVSRTVRLVNQQVAPVGKTFDGSTWQTIGSMVLDSQFISGDEISSGTLHVTLSNLGADGIVVADGIRIVPTIPPDQAIRNLTTVYESSLTVASLIARGTPQDLADARSIADTLLYALEHDNTGGGGVLPTTQAGDRGLRDAYSNGDLATRNDQGDGGALAGEARLAGFSTDFTLVGPSGFALVLDGAFGGNNAFGIMALMTAYFEFGDQKYLDGAREIGEWIYGNLRDRNGPHFPENDFPGAETFGGYFLGYPDQGVVKDAAGSLIHGKSIENNADIFAAFSMIAAADVQLGNGSEAEEWTERANIAGDFVMALYVPGDTQNPRDGHFHAGALPIGTPAGPGLDPTGPQKGGEVLNAAALLDSNTFTVLPLVQAPRYRTMIDWREPLRYVSDTFAQEIDATSGGVSHHFSGFNIVANSTTSQFRPGGPIGGLPEGIAWEFTAQVVATMRILDDLYGSHEFEALANQYMSEIEKAQQFAPFGDGLGLVASTLDGENDDGLNGYAPLDQALGTPFQAIAERVGLAATNWAIYADQRINMFAPQLPLPQIAGQDFVVDDWNYDVTLNDLGFNDFGGNTGTTETAEGITTLAVSPVSNGTVGGSLEVSFDFTGQPSEVFAGYFASLFGLTDTLVSLDGSGQQPGTTTHFPNYFLDTQDVYRGFLPLANRSLEQLQFDVRLESASPVTVKIELRDENDFDVFTRRTLTNTGSDWQTVSLSLPSSFTNSVEGAGNPSAFNWRKVSTFTLIVERNNNADGIHNPDSGQFLVDNLRVVDADGQYPDFDAIREPVSGELNHFYEEAYLDYVRGSSAQYFTDWASTDTRTGGIIQDRATFADLMTVGGAGFQLTTYVIDAERGYMSRADAATRTRDILRVLHDHPQGPEALGTIGYQGFYYHFLGIDGLRKQNFNFTETTGVNEALNTVELSTIDTALVLAGAVTSGQYFTGDTPIEAEIRLLVDEIYGRVNWNFMVDPATHQFFLGWKPTETRDDSGPFGRFKINDAPQNHLGQYSSKPDGANEVPATIDYYSDEGLLIALLAMGSPNPEHRLSREVWDAMIRDTDGGSYVKSYPGSLFTYEFASVWLDTEALGTDNHQSINGQPARPTNFFDNSQAAMLATLNYAIANPNGRATWLNGAGTTRFGISAAEGPFDHYAAYSAETTALADDGGFVSVAASYVVEAEAGTGDGSNMIRGNASGGLTVQLDDGEARTMSINLPYNTTYQLVVRYSNDNFGPLENIAVSVDGVSVGSFAAQDTGDFGAGWDAFVDSSLLGPITLGPGLHQVTISVSGGDGGGFELDKVTLQHGLVLRSTEDGTTTVYGAGSAINHIPQYAIPALWEATKLGLLHPRFGFADAYNLDISDAVMTETVGGEILRTDGAWANRTGFSIDHGPMLIMIDNYLSDEFVPKLFLSNDGIQQALAQVFVAVNADPVITPSLSVPENIASVQVIATDDDLPAQTLTFSIIGGEDQSRFTINSSGLLTFAAAPDYELPVDAGGNNEYRVIVKVEDGEGGESTQEVVVTVTPVNDNDPFFTSLTNFNVVENTTNVGTVTAIDGDLPPETVTYSITGGADQTLFTLTPSGVLSFVSAPNREAPTDSGANNDYEVQVTASDGNGRQSVQNITVTVTNVNEPPGFTSSATFNVNENTTAVGTAVAIDPDLPPQIITYLISGGADLAKFSINSSGVLTFITAPNFEVPTDADTNNVYEVQVTANDGASGLAVQNISVTVINGNDAPVFTSPTTFTVLENTTGVGTTVATDEDLPAQTVTYSISGGTDQAKFSITSDGALTFINGPDFESPTDAGADNLYDVQVTANDGSGGSTVQNITVEVTDVAPHLDLGGPVVTWIRKQPPVVVLPQITVSGDTSLGGGTLTLSVNAIGTARKLLDVFSTPAFAGLGTSSGPQFANGHLTLQILLDQNVTMGGIQSFLRGITFSTKGKGLKTLTRTLEVTLADKNGASSTVSQTINVRKKP